MTLMHRGTLRKRSDFSLFRGRRLTACPLPRPSPVLRAAGRHHLIAPAVICVSDRRGGHFCSCYIVRAKRDVACGATAVCISVCGCVAIYERKTLICCIISCWDSQPPPPPTPSTPSTHTLFSYSSIAGLSAIINSSCWRTEFKPGPYRIFLYMRGGGPREKHINKDDTV